MQGWTFTTRHGVMELQEKAEEKTKKHKNAD